MDINACKRKWYSVIYGTGIGFQGSDSFDYGEELWSDNYLKPLALLIDTDYNAACELNGKNPKVVADYVYNNMKGILSVEAFDKMLTEAFGTDNWRFILKNIASYYQRSQNPADLLKNIKQAQSAVVQDAVAATVSFGLSYVDVSVLFDTNGDIIGCYPECYVTYPTTWCIRPGGHELQRLCNQTVTALNREQIDFIKRAQDIGLVTVNDLAQMLILTPNAKGPGAYMKTYNVLDADCPPADVVRVLSYLPDSFVADYPDEFFALKSLVERDASSEYITPDVVNYLRTIADHFGDEPLADSTPKQPSGYVEGCMAPPTGDYDIDFNLEGNPESRGTSDNIVLDMLKDCDSAQDVIDAVKAYPDAVVALIKELCTGVQVIEKEIPVEKEVIKEVTVEKEVIKEVPVEKEITVEKEVVKEVPVEKVVVKEVLVESSRSPIYRACHYLFDTVRSAYEKDDSAQNHKKWVSATAVMLRLMQSVVDYPALDAYIGRKLEAENNVDVRAALSKAKEIIHSAA